MPDVINQLSITFNKLQYLSSFIINTKNLRATIKSSFSQVF